MSDEKEIKIFCPYNTRATGNVTCENSCGLAITQLDIFDSIYLNHKAIAAMVNGELDIANPEAYANFMTSLELPSKFLAEDVRESLEAEFSCSHEVDAKSNAQLSSNITSLLTLILSKINV